VIHAMAATLPSLLSSVVACQWRRFAICLINIVHDQRRRAIEALEACAPQTVLRLWLISLVHRTKLTVSFSVTNKRTYNFEQKLTNGLRHESEVRYHSATQSPSSMFHFLPEKLLKIVATRGEIFSLKFAKYCLVAGLSTDPLGELKCSPRSSRNKGGYF